MTDHKQSLSQSHLESPIRSHSGTELDVQFIAQSIETDVLHYSGHLLPLILGTLLFTVLGCSLLSSEISESACKTRAFTRESTESARESTFSNLQDARLGIFPFDVPANLAAAVPDRGDNGVFLASRVQQQLMGGRLVGIAEVVPLYDWPGKRDEFLRGNFDTLKLAKDFGYDLVLVGSLQPQRKGNQLSALIKVVDIRNHVTLEYFETSFTDMPTPSMLPNRLRPEDLIPATTHTMIEGLASCIADYLKVSEAQEAGLPDY